MPDRTMPALNQALAFKRASEVQRVKDAAALIKIAGRESAAGTHGGGLAQPGPARPGGAVTNQPRPAPHSVHSEAWWQAISVCEQGGRNHPFFGYFSIMDGSAGGLPWATQVQMAQRIIDRAGDYAWARSCVAAGYRAAPGG